MGKVVPLRPDQVRGNVEWRAGYSAGYNKQDFDSRLNDSISYSTGYSIGISDRLEDEEAIASGDFDGMSEAEKEVIYGPDDLP